MKGLSAIAILVLSLGASAETTPQRTLAIGTRAPKLDARLLNGKQVPSWRKLKGQVVVVDFWATWCGPCVGAIPHLDALHAALKNEPVRFFSVTYEPKAKVQAFLAQHPMATPVTLDNDLATFESFLAWGIPITYVVDGEGTIVAVTYPTKLTVEDIRAVLAGKRPACEQHPGWNDPPGAAKYFRAELLKDREKYGDQ